jgi:hypothetical protein
MSITNSSVIVEMNLSVWTANKIDRRATENVTCDAGANRNAAKVHKNLMAGTNLRKDIADFAAGCRTWHLRKTLPWADQGARLLPTSLFLDYKTEANARRDKFNAMVDEFITNYPTLVYNAQAELGTLFNVNDYPSVEEVRSKFGLRLVFSPVPEAGDFRLDVPTSELNALKNQYEDSFKDRIADAMREPWDRLHKLLTGMSEKLVEPEGEGKKLFHESFVTNAEALCELLTHLNITQDPTLEAARVQLVQAMTGADIIDVRESPAVRADIKSRVDNILSQFNW